jgi:hypothetical protein
MPLNLPPVGLHAFHNYCPTLTTLGYLLVTMPTLRNTLKCLPKNAYHLMPPHPLCGSCLLSETIPLLCKLQHSNILASYWHILATTFMWQPMISNSKGEILVYIFTPFCKIFTQNYYLKYNNTLCNFKLYYFSHILIK